MADESQLKAVGRALLQAMRPGLGSAYMPSQQPTLPTPPVSVAAAPPQLPPYQQPQGVAAYQPPFNPQAASQAPQLPTPPTPQPAYQAPFAGLHNEPLPQFQQPQGLAAYQPPVIPGPQGSYGPGGGAGPQLPPPPPGMAPLQAPPAQWLGLGDQNRTAAFDPTRDANDPRNVNMVGPNGQVNPLQGPMAQTPGGYGPVMPPGLYMGANPPGTIYN